MKRSLLYGVVTVSLAFAASPALAADISFSSGIAQDAFKNLSKEAGAALGFRNLAPAAPLGITGFDIGGEVSAMSIDKNSTYWSSAFKNDAPSYLIIPKIRVRKGLPLGIDVGATYSYISDSNVKMYGAELSKSILDGTLATPAIGIRATYTRLAGVDDLGLQTYGLDASISKGFPFITPYAGAGIILIRSEAKGKLKTQTKTDLNIDLKDEKISVPRVFGGLKLSPLPLLGITAELEYAVRPIYSLKVAASF